MRHRKKSQKFSRPRGQRRALVASLLRAVIINERIITTTARAKYLRSDVDKLINWAKKDSLSHRRLAYRRLKSHSLVKRLFEIIGPRFLNIPGGYSRVLTVSKRKGDGAPLSILELTVRHKKAKSIKKEKSAPGIKPLQKDKERGVSPKGIKPRKGIMSGVKKIFKKKKTTAS